MEGTQESDSFLSHGHGATLRVIGPSVYLELNCYQEGRKLEQPIIVWDDSARHQLPELRDSSMFFKATHDDTKDFQIRTYPPIKLDRDDLEVDF